MKYLGTTILALQLASGLTAANERTQEFAKPQMTFVKAAEPFLKEKYKKDGYIDSNGKVKNGGLGCSAYTSAVLHRMRDGDAWLSHFDWKLFQKYGDEIAKQFGLNSIGKFNAGDLSSIDVTKSLIMSGKLSPDLLCVFNTRKGIQGHVGFVRVKSDGQLIQSHYSGLKAFDGLASGDFRKWLKASQYRQSEIELFLVPE